jgi:hypothetical protein
MQGDYRSRTATVVRDYALCDDLEYLVANDQCASVKIATCEMDHG